MQLGPIGLNAIVSTGSRALRAAGRIAGDFGSRLRQTLQNGTGAAPATDAASGSVRALTARIRGVLASEGVRPNGPVTIGRDDFGRLHVVGDHPDGDRINEALAAHPELGDVFGEVAQLVFQAQSSGQPTRGLPAAYERDGQVSLDLTVEPVSPDVALPRAA